MSGRSCATLNPHQTTDAEAATHFGRTSTGLPMKVTPALVELLVAPSLQPQAAAGRDGFHVTIPVARQRQHLGGCLGKIRQPPKAGSLQDAKSQFSNNELTAFHGQVA